MFKKFSISIIILAALLLISFLLIVFLDKSADAQPSGQIVAYYFHGSFRCPTCYRIGQYAKEAIETNFKEELASGKIVFKTINVEERKNEHFVNDYQLYTKSLVISLVKNSKEVKYKNLTKVWEYISNKQAFFDYVKTEVSNYLKEL